MRSVARTASHASGRRATGVPSVHRRCAVISAALLALTLTALAAPAQWPWEKAEPEPEPVYPGVTVSADDLVAGTRDAGVVLLDARSLEAYVAGHVPGAISAPAPSLPGPPATAEALGRLGLSGEERVVCYGDGAISEEASRLFWLLESAGASDVAVLAGGFEAWVRAGGAADSRDSSRRRTTWTRESDPGRWATLEHVGASFGEKGFELVDARGWDLWEGEPQVPGAAPPGAPPGRRTGHIPHALPFDFREFLSTDGALRRPEDTRATFARLGPRPSSPVDLQDEFIVYGQGGSADGAVGYYLLRRAGVARVSYYPGGFDEWSSRPDLPVTRVIHAEEIQARLNLEPRLLVPDSPPQAFVLLDVRHDRDFGIGHIPGAVNLQSHVFADSLDSTVARHWPSADRSSIPIISYCYGPSCIRSRNCSTMAARAGFVNTERFYGGIEEWRGIGAPVIRAAQ